MHFTRVFTSLAILAAPTLVSSVSTQVTFDHIYDNGGDSLSIVACSDGANGLLTKGFTTFDSLPSFPHIGGAHAVLAWNSPNCGTCWSLTFAGTGKTINVLAIDTAGVGFNIGQKAFDELTGGLSSGPGKVTVDAEQVPESQCGL